MRIITSCHARVTQIYCEMAEAAVEVCVACAQPVPVATKRRRFRSASLSHALPTVSEIFTRVILLLRPLSLILATARPFPQRPASDGDREDQ